MQITLTIGGYYEGGKVIYIERTYANAVRLWMEEMNLRSVEMVDRVSSKQYVEFWCSGEGDAKSTWDWLNRGGR